MLSESTLLVRPEHLNHHGFLFGGRLLEWLDEQAYIAAISRLNPEANLVTVENLPKSRDDSFYTGMVGCDTVANEAVWGR